MTRTREPVPTSPDPGRAIVVNGAAGPGRPQERVFGGSTPDGPLPGRLLVLLSRLHRAEAARGRSGRRG